MSRKVLIVDDDILVLTMLRDMLENDGYEVIEAFDGYEALSQAAIRQPDLVMLDIMMPRLDGKKALARLRADGQTRHIPVIMLTAQNTADDVRECFDLGAADFILKPVDRERLIRKIDTTIRKADYQKSLEKREIQLTGPITLEAVPREERRERIERLRTELGQLLSQIEPAIERLRRNAASAASGPDGDTDARRLATKLEAIAAVLEDLHTFPIK